MKFVMHRKNLGRARLNSQSKCILVDPYQGSPVYYHISCFIIFVNDAKRNYQFKSNFKKFQQIPRPERESNRIGFFQSLEFFFQTLGGFFKIRL